MQRTLTDPRPLLSDKNQQEPLAIVIEEKPQLHPSRAPHIEIEIKPQLNPSEEKKEPLSIEIAMRSPLTPTDEKSASLSSENEVKSQSSIQENIQTKINKIKYLLNLLTYIPHAEQAAADYPLSQHQLFNQTDNCCVLFLATMVIGLGFVIAYGESVTTILTAACFESVLIPCLAIMLCAKLNRHRSLSSSAFLLGLSSQLPNADTRINRLVHQNDRYEINRLFSEIDVEIDLNRPLYKVIDLLNHEIKELKYRQKSVAHKTAFLMGKNARLNQASNTHKTTSIHTAFFKNPLFERETCRFIFEAAGFSKVSNKEKAQEISHLVNLNLFQAPVIKSSPVSPFTGQEITNTILGYLNLPGLNV